MQLFQRSDSNAADNNNSSASSLMRSLSKCFDPPLDEAIVEDDGRRGSGVAGKAGNKGELFISHVMPFSSGNFIIFHGECPSYYYCYIAALCRSLLLLLFS